MVDRTSDLKNWVDVFKSLVSNTKVLKIFAFSNNHYAGHGPATAKLFIDLWSNICPVTRIKVSRQPLPRAILWTVYRSTSLSSDFIFARSLLSF